MSDSVKIDNDGKAEFSKHGVSTYSGEKGKVVPLTSNIREGGGQSITLSDSESKYKDGFKTRVTVGAGEGSGLDIRNQHDHPVNDPRQIKDSDSIRVGNTRCSIKTALQMGLIQVDAQGNYSAVDGGYEKAVQADPKASEPQAPRETFVTHDDQVQLDAIHERVSPALFDSYMNNVVASMMSGQSAECHIADMASAMGADPASLATWTEGYVNNLMSQGLDATVRHSGGQLSTEEIWTHLDKCSPAFKSQLLTSLHFGSNSMISQLIEVINGNRVV